MSLLKIEGFEKYSSLNDIKSYLDYDTFQTPTIISSSDGVVTPRNSLSSVKMLSTITAPANLGGLGHAVYYPKFAISNLTNHSNGIVGFAYYAYTPSGGSYSPTTPIAAICDSDGKPHFFICVNGSMQIEIRRWNTAASLGSSNTTTASTYKWNSPLVGTLVAFDNNYCQQTTTYNHHLSTPVTVGQSCLTKNVSYWASAINTDALPLILTTSVNTLEINSWNYIEVEYVIDSSSQGLIKVRINRNSDSNDLDGTVSSVQTTNQITSNVGQIAFGTFWAHDTSGSAFGSSTSLAGWPTYFDDIYIINKDATLPNDFLGSIGCRKGDFDTTVLNTAPEGNLESINDATFSGTSNLNNRIKLALNGHNIHVKAANLSVGDNDTIRFVQPVIYGYNTIVGTALNFKSNLSNTDSSNYELYLSNNSNLGGVTLGPVLLTDPQGNSWTSANLKDTTFKYEA